MQRPPQISQNLYDALGLQAQRPNILVEFYLNNTLPTNDGFNPDDAILRVANSPLEFLTLPYAQYVKKVGIINKTIGPKFNSVSIDLNNHDRTMAAFALSTVNRLEGMFIVIRLVSREFVAGSLADSYVAFTGKCEKPYDANSATLTINAKQYIGSVDEETPWRGFDTEDEDGRAADDPEFEGFVFKQTNFTSQYTERVPRGGFLGILGFKKTVTKTVNHTSQSVDAEKVVPLVLGRAQVNLIGITSLDVGGAINSIMAASEGPIKAWFDHRVLTPRFSQPIGAYYRYGYTGGTNDQLPLTSAQGGDFYAGNAHYSKTAWVAFFVNGTDVAVEEGAPESVAIIMGFLMPVPDIGGDFVLESWTDNPAFQTRWLLTHPKIFNLEPEFINDPQCIKTACYCDDPVLDNTNGELIALDQAIEPLYGTSFRRYHSTGLFTPEYFLHYYLDTGQDPLPELTLPTEESGLVVFYNPTGGFPTLPTLNLVRRRFTSNIYLREKMKSADFLFRVLLPTFRGFLTQNAKGQIDIKCKRPADNTIIRSASSIGATEVAVNSILAWVADSSGEVIVGTDLLTSEVRAVTGTRYSSVANSITLSVSGSLTASGATLTGGDNDNPATGSVTVTGLGALTVTIDGHAVSYTTIPADTTGTAAAMLTQFLKADPNFKTYLKFVWDAASPTLISIQSKLGFLELSSALENAHSIAEEVLRIQMSFGDTGANHSNLAAANILERSMSWPIGSRQSSVNRIDSIFIDSPQDFRSQPLRTRDPVHIAQVKKTLPQEVTHTGVDNFSQAKRLQNSVLAELRDCDFLMQHTADRRAMLLEEGDLICNTHASGGFRNVPLRIEEVSLDLSRMAVAILARRYLTSAHSDEAAARNVPLPTALPGAAGPPNISFNSVDFPPSGLTQTTIEGVTSVQGGAIFGASVFGQTAKVSLKKPGEVVFTQIAVIQPDSNLEAIFNFLSPDPGTYTVQLEVCFLSGLCNPTKPTAQIVIGAVGSVALTGVQATGLIGNVGAPNLIAITGVQATGAVGTVGPADLIPLTGVQATDALGTLAAGGFWDNPQSPTWAGITGATESPTGRLTKTAASGWGNCGAVSVETFSGDCRLAYVRYAPATSSNGRMIGIGADASCSTFSTIDFGQNNETTVGLDAEISVYENGTNKDADNQVDDEPTDDGVVLEIERVGTQIKHYYTPFVGTPPAPGLPGRTLIYTSLVSSSGTIRINVAIFTNTRIVDAADMDWRAI